MNPYRYARHLVILALVAGALGVAQHASAQGAEEVRAILADRADAHGVSAAYLTAIAQCESRLVPTAVGDSGHSHGLVQLSDLSTGLLSHYHAPGWRQREGDGPLTATTGWAPTCPCDAGAPVPCTVLDPFAGSGTTLLVARRLGRHAIGVELQPNYAQMARERITQDAPLFEAPPPVPSEPPVPTLFDALEAATS